MTSSADPWRLSAAEASALLARRELSPVDLVESVLARIEAVNPALNAIVALDADGARAAAAASAARHAAGAPLGPLDGIPLTVKDNILVAGLPAVWGSNLYRDHVPEADELPVARLRAAGMVVLGKTNVPEFTLQGYTDNRVFGPTRNPWNTDLTPGGSSGGGVAAVASGMGPVALGTDGGGSIRRPASHTGLVGLKPSIGLVARCDSLPQILLDCEVIGPLTRTVADAALLTAHMSGADVRDPLSRWAAPLSPVDLSPPPPLRILYVPRFGDNPVDPAIAAACAAAAARFAALGHAVEEGPVPFDVDSLTELWGVIGQAAVAWLLDAHPGREAEVGESYPPMAEAGRATGAARYLDMMLRIAAFRRHTAELFERVDVVMTPSAAALPWPAATPFPAEIDGRPVGPRGHAVFTNWVNIAGHPGLNLPADPDPATGLPIGFQLVGGFGRDGLLLRLGAQYEAAHPFAQRRPPI